MKRLYLITVLSILFFMSGCSLLSPVQLPEQSTYAITTMKSLPSPTRAKTRASLLVSMPIASAGYQTAEMVYVDIPYKLKHFANNRWVAPPANMILPILAEQLRATGYFRAVVTPPFSGTVNDRLDTQLIVLQQEFFQPTSVVHLVIQATVVSNTNNRVIASRRFQVKVAAPANNPYSGVLATNKAAMIITQRIARFVTQTVRH